MAINYTGLNEDRAKYYLQWLKKYFYGVYTEEEVEERFFASQKFLNYDWDKKVDEIEFYKKTNHYTFNLLYWHSMTDKIDIMKKLAAFFADAKTVLDYGGGIGVDANDLLELGYQVEVVDFISPSTIAGKSLHIDLNFKDITLHPKDSKYDLVLAIDLIGHISNVPLILDELVSMTNKYLVIGLDLCCFEDIPMHHKENEEWQLKTQPYLEEKGFKLVGQVSNNIVMKR